MTEKGKYTEEEISKAREIMGYLGGKAKSGWKGKKEMIPHMQLMTQRSIEKRKKKALERKNNDTSNEKVVKD